MKTTNVILAMTISLSMITTGWAQVNIDTALIEANSNFTYQGKSIHPGLVKEFASLSSDPGTPTTISVDVSAEHGNEYFEDEAKVQKDGSAILQKEGEQEYFYYKWLGKLNNGIHVLVVGSGGDGSGVFKDLFFVRFDKGEGFRPEGKKYDRLLMTIVRYFPLGDRDDAEIKVLPDRVIVGKSKYRDVSTAITF